MHWNVLADYLANDFPKVPDEYLSWKHRFPLIIEHIKNVDPDVVGLSETDVQPLYMDYKNAMKSLGYSDYMFEKYNRISGSAIFYKDDKFTCLK